METQPPTANSPRRFNERAMASMRPRSAGCSSEASSSSFFKSRLAKADMGFCKSIKLAASSSMATLNPSTKGRQSVSREFDEDASDRAKTCCRTRAKKSSAAPSGCPVCMRLVQPGPGSPDAARKICCNSFSDFSSPDNKSPKRSPSPRPRRRSVSGPRNQRRSSEASIAVR